jgi:intraflagellar transport protein 172
MPPQIEQTLSTVSCDSCGQAVYEASLQCPGCSARWEACAVSGYPACAGARVTSKSGQVARREEWNQWVSKFQSCPVTGAPAQPIY